MNSVLPDESSESVRRSVFCPSAPTIIRFGFYRLDPLNFLFTRWHARALLPASLAAVFSRLRAGCWTQITRVLIFSLESEQKNQKSILRSLRFTLASNVKREHLRYLNSFFTPAHLSSFRPYRSNFCLQNWTQSFRSQIIISTFLCEVHGKTVFYFVGFRLHFISIFICFYCLSMF